MSRAWKRLLWLVAALAAALVVLALLYAAGMRWLEGSPRSFWAALSWAAETVTTTGYGADHSWHHPAMVVFVTLTQFLGVFLVFLIFPIYLIPLMEERFEARIPRKMGGLQDHIVIYRYGAAVAGLVQDLMRDKRSVVVLEPYISSARATALSGVPVILGGITDESLAGASLETAAALIANGSDDENAAVSVAARQSGFTGTIVAVATELTHRRAIQLAGASEVVTPKYELGAALAHRVCPKVASTAGVFSYGRKLRLESVRMVESSPLAGRRLDDAKLGKNWGVSVVAQWVGGDLVTDLSGATVIEPEGTLVVAGSREAIERMRVEAIGSAAERGSRHVVGGYGEVGRRATELLREAGEEVYVIDRRADPGVDLVADFRDPETLVQADVRNAGSVLLALDSDAATLFATLVVHDLAPSVPLVVRVNDAGNLDNIHRAGASYAVSLDQVAGRILAAHLVEEEAIALDPRFKVLCLSAVRLAGRSLEQAGVRENTGTTVVAVERAGQVHADLAPSFVFAANDDVYICGSTDAVRRAKHWLKLA